jgi:hypothetical protein
MASLEVLLPVLERSSSSGS